MRSKPAAKITIPAQIRKNKDPMVIFPGVLITVSRFLLRADQRRNQLSPGLSPDNVTGMCQANELSVSWMLPLLPNASTLCAKHSNLQ